MDMETYEFGRICESFHLTNFACIRICSDVPKPLNELINIAKKTENKRLKEAAQVPLHDEKTKKKQFGIPYEKVEDQTQAFRRLMRKLLNFHPVIPRCYELLSIFTLHNLMPSKVIVNPKEMDIVRGVNPNLAHIYEIEINDESVPKKSMPKNLALILHRINAEHDALLSKYKEIWNGK